MTIDFSDFDRRIKNLTDGLDASKDRPFQEEASKKLEAFLKENEQFFAEYKQNPHVKDQLNHLSGRIQSAFPEDPRARHWASYLQFLATSRMKTMDLVNFYGQLTSLKELIEGDQGEKMTPEMAAQLKAFLEHPQNLDFFASYKHNPEVGSLLVELGILLLQKFPRDLTARRFAVRLQQIVKTLQLPPEITPEFIKHLPIEQWDNLPDEWDSFTADIKIKWINENHVPLHVLGYKTGTAALPFLKEYGYKLRYLELDGGRYVDDTTNESFRELLSYCPNLKIIELFHIKISELPPLPSGLEVFSNTGIDSALTRYHSFSDELKVLYLSNIKKRISVEQLPRGLIFFYARNAEHLPPFPDGLRALILIDTLNLEHPLPAELECLVIMNSPLLTRLPELPETLKFLILINLEGLQQNFAVPRGLQFAKIQRVSVQPELPSNCETDPTRAPLETEQFLVQLYLGSRGIVT